MRRLLNFFSGCSHRSVTFPQTKRGVTWVTCVECGAEFGYDWQTMRRGPELSKSPEPRELVQIEVSRSVTSS